MWPVPRLEVQASNGRKRNRAVRDLHPGGGGMALGEGAVGSLLRPQGWGVSKMALFSPGWSASHGL